MRAAVYHGPGQLTVDEIPTPDGPGPGEVTLQVDAATICGTDLKIFLHGKSNLTPPRVLGHELAGTIVTVGAGVAGFAIGDRVAVDPVISCGHCRYCLRSQPALCPTLRVIAYDEDGGFAPFIRIPAAAVATGSLVRLPEGLPAREAALMEPLACAINAHERIETQLGDHVLILGAGPLGVMHGCVARVRGAHSVLLADLLPARLELAASFGFDGLVDASEAGFADKVRRLTGGEGADVIVVANPAPAAVEQAVSLAAKGGRISLFGGLPQTNSRVSVDGNLVHYRELTLSGAFGASRRHNTLALALLTTGAVPADRIITHTVPLAEITAGLELVKSGRALKVAVDTAA